VNGKLSATTIAFSSCSPFSTDFLSQNKCFFSGGTAIVLALNEYRKSVGIDFLCAFQEDYREMCDFLK